MTDITKELFEALEEERRIRLLGQQTDVHWESLRDARRAAYAATDAALATYRSQAEGDGWLPIETAPKDVNVLLFDADERTVGEAFFDYAESDCWVWSNSGMLVVEPTHWRPLPAAPSLPSPNGEKQGAPLSNPRSQT